MKAVQRFAALFIAAFRMAAARVGSAAALLDQTVQDFRALYVEARARASA
jgi:hypothetical protein